MSNPRIFVGCMSTCFVWADRHRIKEGDYATLARLPYHTLALWIADDCPAHLRGEIEAEARRLQAQRGRAYPVTTTQTVTLGGTS